MRDVAIGMGITVALLVPAFLSLVRQHVRRIEALSMYVGMLEEQLRNGRRGHDRELVEAGRR